MMGRKNETIPFRSYDVRDKRQLYFFRGMVIERHVVVSSGGRNPLLP